MADFVDIVFYLIGFLVTITKCELSAEECLQFGLQKADLMCNWCEQLSQFELDVMKEKCLQCCQSSEVRDPIKKYPRAQLEVCG